RLRPALECRRFRWVAGSALGEQKSGNEQQGRSGPDPGANERRRASREHERLLVGNRICLGMRPLNRRTPILSWLAREKSKFEGAVCFALGASSSERETVNRLAQVLEQRHPSRLHPFDDEDIAVGVEAGVVGVDEFAGLPLAGLAADLEAVENFLAPGQVVAQVDDGRVVLVEERDAGVQIWDQQYVAPDVEVGGE